MPLDAEGARAVGAGDRQEHRNPPPYRRPPLHHRARTRGMEREFGGVDRGARSAAPVFGGVIESYFVMAGHSRPKDGVASARLYPAIHGFLASRLAKTWMPGSSPGMTS